MRMTYLVIITLQLFVCSCKSNKGEGTKNVAVHETEDKFSDTIINTYPSGKVKEKGYLTKGLKDGVWKTFSEQGKLVGVEYYEKGKKITDIDVEDFDLKYYSFEGLDILLPVKWNFEKTEKGQSFFLQKNKPKNDDLNEPSVIISLKASDIEPDADIETFAKSKALIGNSNDQFRTVRGMAGLTNKPCSSVILFGYLQNPGHFSRKAEVVYRKCGNKVFVITFAADEEGSNSFLYYKGLFIEITSNLKYKS